MTHTRLRNSLLSVLLLAGAALSCDAPGSATRVPASATGPIEPAAGAGARGDQSITCTAPELLGSLAAALHEASGLAPASRRGHFWVHNDSEQPPALYRINLRGRIVQRVILSGLQLKDWEDIAAARCGAGTCLYLADIGDNVHARATVRVLRVREPGADTRRIAEADIFPFRFPDGPADAEAIFVLPGERLHVITKGRNRAVTLYRYPGPLRPDTVTLERVRELRPGMAQFPQMVTGASASRDGHHVAVRSYRFLDLYYVRNAALVHAARVKLEPLAERQGEGVALGGDGTVVLVSERADRRAGSIARVRCVLP